MVQMPEEKTRTKRKLWVAALLLPSILFFLFVFNVQQGSVVEALNNTEKQLNVVRIATGISSYAKRAEGHLLLYMIAYEKIDRDKFFERHASIVELTEDIAPHLINNIQRKHLAVIKDNTAILLAEGVKIIEILDQGNNAVPELSVIRAFHNASSAIRKKGVFIVEATTKSLEKSNKNFKNDHKIINLLLSFTFVLSLCLFAATYILSQKVREEKEKADQARKGAEYANRAKSEFLANISHEIRTPLNSIIGFAQMLACGIPVPLGHKKHEEYVKYIETSGTYLLEVINDILDISKIEAGEITFEETDVNIHDVVRSCLRMCHERAEKKGIMLITEIPIHLPAFRADIRHVKQIMLNLITNAIKFTPGDGKVTISAGTDGQGAFFLCIKDTGIGIAPCNIQKVLEPFLQVESVMTRSHEGSGLGLPLSKRLAEVYGGTLTIDSKEGAGTTVMVRFPPERVVSNA